MEKECADCEGGIVYSRHFGYECKIKKGKDGGNWMKNEFEWCFFFHVFNRPPAWIRKGNLFWPDPLFCWLRKARALCALWCKGWWERGGRKWKWRGKRCSDWWVRGTIIFCKKYMGWRLTQCASATLRETTTCEKPGDWNIPLLTKEGIFWVWHQNQTLLGALHFYTWVHTWVCVCVCAYSELRGTLYMNMNMNMDTPFGLRH